MTKRLTPAEAWEHVKALTHRDVAIRKSWKHSEYTEVHMDGYCVFIAMFDIDWGDLTQWPPKEPERKWRDAVWPEDWGKPARFRDSEVYQWREATLQGHHPKRHYKWWAGDHGVFVFCQVEDIPAQAQTPPTNYMLEALRYALSTLEKGIEVRIQDQWPALKAILPETIRKVKEAIERAEADLGAQKQPSSVAKIQAETKAVARELENVGGSEQVPTESLISQFIKLRYPDCDYELAMQTMAGLLMRDLEIWKQLLQHPADREPTDEEVERACLAYAPWLLFHGKHIYAWEETENNVRRVLKAWQQVWRESQ